MVRIRVASAIPVFVTLLVLSGCASYQARPLPTDTDLASSVSALQVPDGRVSAGGTASAPFDASDGLSLAEAVTLGVFNNPDLKAARARRGVGQAQLLQAGLLPNPQITASMDHPTSGGPGLVNAYGVGINLDLQSLLTHGANKAAGRASARQVDLQVLWREWQVAEQIRQIYGQCRTLDQLQTLYKAHLAQLKDLYAEDQAALTRGDITLSQSDADLAALTDVTTTLSNMERRRNKVYHSLNALLGLQPGVSVPLRGKTSIPVLSERAFNAALKALPKRRPDLLALRAGYQSQEENVRAEILKQFPNLSLGVNRARDTGNVHTIGLSLAISLPLFNHNQGHIAVARATRARLHQEYQARLDAAAGETDRLYRESALIDAHIRDVRAALPILTRAARNARQALRDGDLNAATYNGLRNRLFKQRADLIQSRGDLQQTRLSLLTLLALPFGAPVSGVKTQ